MPSISDVKFSQTPDVEDQLNTNAEQHNGTSSGLGWLFKGQVLYFADHAVSNDSSTDENARSNPQQQQRLNLASNLARFASARVVKDVENKTVTHVIVCADSTTDISALRKSLSKRVGTKTKIPHIVTVEWVEQSWVEKTLLDEERKCLT